MAKLLSLIASAFLLILILSNLQQGEAKLGLKKLLKAGLILGVLGSRKLPKFLPLPIPIPIRTNQHHKFGGGHFGADYYDPQGSGFIPAYGPYQGGGGLGHIVYEGYATSSGYGTNGGWW